LICCTIYKWLGAINSKVKGWVPLISVWVTDFVAHSLERERMTNVDATKRILRASTVLSGVWIAVESFTVLAAGFGIGPLVEVVANENGRADAHTQRFAALLAALLLLNLYAISRVAGMVTVRISNESTIVLVHTVMVVDALAVFFCGVVEAFHGDLLAIAWHVGLVLAFLWLLVVRRDDWHTETTKKSPVASKKTKKI